MEARIKPAAIDMGVEGESRDILKVPCMRHSELSDVEETENKEPRGLLSFLAQVSGQVFLPF